MNFSFTSSSFAFVDARSSGNADICSLNVSTNSFTCGRHHSWSMCTQRPLSLRNTYTTLCPPEHG